jgi:heme/copper-type cytochrome/quinol oxidase subunit 2
MQMKIVVIEQEAFEKWYGEQPTLGEELAVK